MSWPSVSALLLGGIWLLVVRRVALLGDRTLGVGPLSSLARLLGGLCLRLVSSLARLLGGLCLRLVSGLARLLRDLCLRLLGGLCLGLLGRGAGVGVGVGVGGCRGLWLLG